MASDFLIVVQEPGVPVEPAALRKAERQLNMAARGKRRVVVLPPGLRVEAACCACEDPAVVVAGRACEGAVS